jgi:hypothetical protein
MKLRAGYFAEMAFDLLEAKARRLNPGFYTIECDCFSNRHDTRANGETRIKRSMGNRHPVGREEFEQEKRGPGRRPGGVGERRGLSSETSAPLFSSPGCE